MSRIIFTATNDLTGARVDVISNGGWFTVEYSDDCSTEYVNTRTFQSEHTAIRHALFIGSSIHSGLAEY